MMGPVRQPAVAGLFYPAEEKALEAELDRLLAPGPDPAPFRAAVVPHAGWRYSGRVAGAVYRRLDLPRLVVFLGPNHTGSGPAGSVMCHGRWALPGGDVPIAEGLARDLLDACPGLTDDDTGHRQEHAIEVQLPFVRRLCPGVSFVPVALGRANPAFCVTVGEGLAGVLALCREPVGLICSTDLNHYEPQTVSKVKDRLIIDAVLTLSAEDLVRAVRDHRVSMCGLAPALVMLAALRIMNHGSPELVRYETSGDVNGDYARVVGYAGVIVPPSR